MKKSIIKRYFAICVMGLALSTRAMACGSEASDHNYYMFSVFDRDKTAPGFLYDIADYWRNYAGAKDDGNVNYYLYNSDDVMGAATRKKDTEMQAYLKQLNAYIAVCAKLNPNSWEYPSKEEQQAARQSLFNFANAAVKYKGSRLKSQYALMLMRVNMMKGLQEQNIKYWNSTASKLTPSMWREAMRNIYARSLWKTGKHQQALDIYAEQGDMASIRVLARNYRNLAGIQSIYLKNPNSPMLAYLVQDFVNNCQQTVDSRKKGELDKEWMTQIGSKIVLRKEALDFIAFADKVIGEGKTQTPCLWRSATAMLHFLYGQQKEAAEESEEACRLNGTARQKDNARAIRLLTIASNYKGSAAESKTLVGELTWLYGKAKEECTDDIYRNHYVEVQERIIYRALHNRLLSLSKETSNKKAKEYAHLAQAMHGMMDAYERGYQKGKPGEKYLDKYIYSSDNFDNLDSLSASQIADYYAFVTSQHSDAFSQYVCQTLYRNADFFRDLIGTKYLAEGNFGEALRWLKEVPLSFIDNQPISFYAEKRSYTVPFWFRQQKVNDEAMWGLDSGFARMKENPKVKFCEEMGQLIGQYNMSREGEAKEQLAYQLAVRYYQASCYGDCWYLSHYGKSVTDSARVGEADFGAITVNYLKESKRSSNLQLRYHSLYALASIDIDPWQKTIYDANWDEKTVIQKKSTQYQALAEWSKFRHEHPEVVDAFTTKCDVLKAFEKSQSLSSTSYWHGVLNTTK